MKPRDRQSRRVGPMDVQRWAEAIRADPDAYRLPAVGPWMTPERAAAYVAAWSADELAGQPSPASPRRLSAGVADESSART
jgi:hypothetical protein